MIAGGVWIDMKCLAGAVDGLRAAGIISDDGVLMIPVLSVA
jgi:hypothetical protein